MNKCPNCHNFVEPQTELCPTCGYRLKSVKDRSWIRAIAIVLLIIVGIPSLLCGGCFFALGGMDRPAGMDPTALVAAAIGLGIFSLSLWFVVFVYKKE